MGSKDSLAKMLPITIANKKGYLWHLFLTITNKHYQLDFISCIRDLKEKQGH